MQAERYTESQILCGLREVWEHLLGGDHDFSADTQIVTFMQADGTWHDLDFADVFREIEHFFGFTCSNEEWKEFFGYSVAEHRPGEWERDFAPRLTFNSLARFIADRAPVIASFNPITVFGRECASAGVFTGLCRVAEKVTQNSARLTPSTPVIDVMRGHALDDFWTKTRWMTDNSIPQLSSSWRDVNLLTGWLAVLTAVGGLATAWLTSNPTWSVHAIVGAFALHAMASAYKCCSNPLPPDIVTFRDLASSIVQTRNAIFVTSRT